MAVNIFEKYGIKEVANVYFEALEDDTRAGVYKGDIVLFLDTLKTSTIETSAEQTDARGGWGNPKLITWDYGKEITLTLTDALISLESLRFMLGGAIHRPSVDSDKVVVHYTEEVVIEEDGKINKPIDHITGKKFARAIVGTTTHPIRLINYGGGTDSASAGSRTQITNGTLNDGASLTFTNPALNISGIAPKVGDHVRIFWEEEVSQAADKDYAVEVTISPDTFPGTYRVVGDTFMRSQETGADEAFQFVIAKAKVASNVTITLEAEGDPSTFEMQLTVLRSSNERGENEMMKLIRYSMTDTSSGNSDKDIGSLTGGSI